MGMPPVAGQFQPGMGGIQASPLIPPVSMPNYNIPGNYLPNPVGVQGFMPPAIGGQWNQLAQQMAGPMYLPSAPARGIPSPLTPPPKATPPVTMPIQPPSQLGGGGISGVPLLGGGGGGGLGSSTGLYSNGTLLGQRLMRF
jgi:hypothetical protein